MKFTHTNKHTINYNYPMVRNISTNVLNIMVKYIELNDLLNFFVQNEININSRFAYSLYEEYDNRSYGNGFNDIFAIFPNVMILSMIIYLEKGIEFQPKFSLQYLKRLCLVGTKDDKHEYSDSFEILCICANIDHLTLEKCHVINLDPILCCKKLEAIQLVYCPKKSGIRVLAEMTGLKAIVLDQCAITKWDIGTFERCKGLEAIMFDSCDYLVDLNEIVISCEKLTTFCVINCPIKNLDFLCKCRNLQYVCIRNCKQLVSVEALKIMSGLIGVAIEECKKLENIRGLGGEMLEEINLIQCEGLKNLRGLAVCKNLKKLMVSHCGIESVDGIERCEELKYLDVSYCGKLIDVSVMLELKKLRKIYIQGCVIPNLEFLRLRGVGIVDS